ncbi:hypothetical protein SeMB42_g07432 [Synchytrium endobioticum]|uniref:Uncharacterized protein n=1 Tax=Synchytrium endobioticum TaxID=286115 RepID=A0A507C250_9FUNG|nr:hypothetical protein SeMB42_g07432 [Synchytrium endobioticum]
MDDVNPLFDPNDICIKDWRKELERAENLLAKLWKDRFQGPYRNEVAVITTESFMNYFKNINGSPSGELWMLILEKGLAKNYAPLAVNWCHFLKTVTAYWEARLEKLLSDESYTELLLQLLPRMKLRKSYYDHLLAVFAEVMDAKDEQHVQAAMQVWHKLRENFDVSDSLVPLSIETEQSPRVEAVPNRAEHDRFSSEPSLDGSSDSTPSTSTSGHLGTSHGPSSSTSRPPRRSGGRRSGRDSRRLSK